jgi:hypothetical protein
MKLSPAAPTSISASPGPGYGGHLATGPVWRCCRTFDLDAEIPLVFWLLARILSHHPEAPERKVTNTFVLVRWWSRRS